MPVRIQRKRTKGFRLPPNCVYVGRPTLLGNPWKASNEHGAVLIVAMYRDWLTDILNNYTLLAPKYRAAIAALRGKDLACWCPLVDKDGNPVPCHAEILLKLANA